MDLGHESSGTVIATGSGCQLLRIGDRVALGSGIPCRICPLCNAGTYNLCTSMQFSTKLPQDGTTVNYYILPEYFCVPLPACLSLEEGALVETLAEGVHICSLAGVKPGSSVIVFGAGPIGLLCSAIAQSFGATKIIAVDIFKFRLDFAATYAATGVFDATYSMVPKENARAIIKRFALGTGADIAIDTSGVELSVATAIHVIKKGGTCVQAAMGVEEISFPIMATCKKEITVKGSSRPGPIDYKLAVDLLAGSLISVSELIANRFKFEEADLVEAQAAVEKRKECQNLSKGSQSNGV